MNKFAQNVRSFCKSIPLPSARTVVAVAGVTVLAATGHAAVDTELSGAVTDTTTFWGTVYDLKLAILIAGVGLAFLAKLKGR